MPTIVGPGFRQSQKNGNDKYFKYAIVRLGNRGFELSAEASLELRRVLYRAAKIAGVRGRNSKRDRIARYHGLRPNSAILEKKEKKFFSSIDLLVNEITQNKNIRLLSKQDLLSALQSLCPIWPFCR